MRLPIRSLLVLCLSLAGCGAAVTPSTTARLLEETRIVAMRDETGGYRFDTYTAEDLFRQGTTLQADAHCPEAVARYDRIAEEFTSSRYLSPSLYNAALCLQQSGDLEASATHYYRLVDHLPDSEDAKVARLQLTGILITLERWQEALASAELLLARRDMQSDERLEAMARRAQALFGMRRLEEATTAADDAGTYYRTRHGDEAIVEPYFAAAAMFVRAESIRARSEAMTMPTSDVQAQHETLERRAQLILDAQRAYFDTIRLTDAHWAAAAGYRIGSMYETLYADMTAAPVPPPSGEMNDQQLAMYRDAYRAELRSRVEPLVRHAIRYWELTLLMVERTGVDTQWAVRTRSELERARQLLATGALPQQDRGTALADPRGGVIAPESTPDAAP
jgi:tetratricopeptide (TPR) repeat protein